MDFTFEDLFPKGPVKSTLHKRVVCRKCQGLIEEGQMMEWKTIRGILAGEHTTCPVKIP